MLFGIIKRIVYDPKLCGSLKSLDINTDVNTWPGCCLITDGSKSFAVSKWISPKRTRSFPYKAVYNTLQNDRKVTIIPLVKDEGIGGDRDYLNWSTIALMSLLNVHVILAYYDSAVPNGIDKITKQRLNSDHIKAELKKLESYHSSALHWNMDQMEPKNLNNIMDSVIKSYTEISKNTGVKLHNEKGLLDFKEQLNKTSEDFKKYSNLKASDAQQRELLTKHALESIEVGDKTPIVIENFHKGIYYFTVDSVFEENGTTYLMECKNTTVHKLPSPSDIKDGLLKVSLYKNIDELKNENQSLKFIPGLKLTSAQLLGEIDSHSNDIALEKFYKDNNFKKSEIKIVNLLMQEAQANGIYILITKSN